ncbi:MAG: M23 family metallopeptidase [Clostridia bacterium]|nr:M23 family metallopeptidase [Clostridia bacterium]
MRRGRREKIEKNSNVKYLFYLSGGTLLIIFITFVITFIIYNNKLDNYSSLTTEKIADLVPNDTSIINTELEQASTDIGKTIEEAINTIENKQEEIEEVKTKTEQNITNVQETVQTNVEPVIIKDPEFISPVEGEVMREFAKDSLIYSETLEEWITHLGIDIKANRTTVVKAAEAGSVSSIKNDPRYGLTVVIEHVNGFKSIYSNLLTTEFISEGEKVEKGQSIATVGNSASFEIIDEPHLHFEIIKDNINVDPKIYMSFGM